MIGKHQLSGTLQGKRWCRTSQLESARVEDTLVVDVPVILGYHGDNREAGLDSKVKSTLLERSYVMIRARGACPFRENPNRGVTLLQFFSGSLK